jgi:hypothetical protein
MPINPTTLKALIDTQITNETVDFAITPAEVGGRMKDIVDYASEQIALTEVLTNKSTNVTADGSSDTKYPSVKAVKDYVDANSGGSAIYKILIQQSGTSNPSITVLKNTSGLTFSISRQGVGVYRITFSELVLSNINLKVNFNSNAYNVPIFTSDNLNLFVDVYIKYWNGTTFVASDDVINKAVLEIEFL